MAVAVDKICHSKDRLLPVQGAINDLYKESPAEYYLRLYDLLASFDSCPDFMSKYNLIIPEKFSYLELGSDTPSLTFLQFMIRLGNYKNILEIGTFIGLSAMYFAEASKDGNVTTVEKGKEFYEIAKKNIQANNYESRVRVIHSDAIDVLAHLDSDEKFDFIYLDGDKDNYDRLFSLLLPRLTEKGLFIIDDVLFNGDVLNDEPTSEKGLGVKRVLDDISKNKQLEASLIPVSNGKLLVRRV